MPLRDLSPRMIPTRNNLVERAAPAVLHPDAISHAGLLLIARFEGFLGSPYNDADTPPNATIGFGHMLHHGPVLPVWLTLI